jgi:hypothetical protein
MRRLPEQLSFGPAFPLSLAIRTEAAAMVVGSSFSLPTFGQILDVENKINILFRHSGAHDTKWHGFIGCGDLVWRKSPEKSSEEIQGR